VPFDIKNAIALLCGPEIMLRFTVRGLLDRNVPEKNIFLSMERNMKCAIGHCGRCQYVSNFVCKDGPVFSYSGLEPFFSKKEI
jgi:NAD(P)H-flavin reductase